MPPDNQAGLDEIEAALADAPPQQDGLAEIEAALAAPVEAKAPPAPQAAPAPEPERPWYKRYLADPAEAALRAATQTVTAGFGDELAGKAADLFTGQDGHIDQYRDANAKAREDQPVASFAGGLAPALIPGVGAALGGSLLAQTAKGAAVLAASKMGNATGDISERGNQVVDDAVEHPFMTAGEVAAPAILHGAGKAATVVGGKFKDVGNELLTHLASSPAQRAAKLQLKGPGALVEQGQAMRDAGLTKGHGLGRFLPVNASRIAGNAEAVVDAERGGEGPIHELESAIRDKVGHVTVDSNPIANALEGDAAQVGRLKLPGNDAEQAASRLQSAAAPFRMDLPPAELPPAEFAPLARPELPNGPAQQDLPLDPMAPPAGPGGAPLLDESKLLPPPGPAQPPPLPARPAPMPPEQMSLDLPRDGAQMSLPLDESGQMGLDFPQSKLATPDAGQADLTLPFPDMAPERPVQRTAVNPDTGRGMMSQVQGMYGKPMPEPAPVPRQSGLEPWQQRLLRIPQQPSGGGLTPEFMPPGMAPHEPLSPTGEQMSLPGTRPEPSQMELPAMAATTGPQQAPVPYGDLASRPIGPSNPPNPRDSLGNMIDSVRHMGRDIDWKKLPGRASSMAEQDALKTAWKGGKDIIGGTLDQASHEGTLDPALVDRYRNAQKTFHTAADVLPGSLRQAERQKSSMGDGITGALLGGVMNKGNASETVYKVGRGAQGLGRLLQKSGPTAVVLSSQERTEANDSVKAEIKKNWYDRLAKTAKSDEPEAI